jgi:hypothetical protein
MHALFPFGVVAGQDALLPPPAPAPELPALLVTPPAPALPIAPDEPPVPKPAAPPALTPPLALPPAAEPPRPVTPPLPVPPARPAAPPLPGLVPLAPATEAPPELGFPAVELSPALLVSPALPCAPAPANASAPALAEKSSSELREPQPATRLEKPPKNTAPLTISRFIGISVSLLGRGAKLHGEPSTHRLRRQASAISRAMITTYCGAPPGRQSPVTALQVAPAAQSTAEAHGKAHFWNCTLQRAKPQD